MFSDKLPITYQLAQVIRAAIIRGTYPPGYRLPTELQLTSDYGVSVITVQRALKTLEDEGLIARHRGKGTFVAEMPPHLVAPKTPTALDLMLSDEFSSDTEILEKKIVPTPAHVQQKFAGITKLMMIRRLVRLEGQPWSYSTHYVIPELGRKMTTHQLKRYPMFRILREFLGISFDNVEVNLEAVTAPLEITSLLQVDPLAPVLLFNGALYASDGLLVDIPEIYYRGDRFKFRFTMNLATA
jgi:GntR family transcriptional regulator